MDEYFFSCNLVSLYVLESPSLDKQQSQTQRIEEIVNIDFHLIFSSLDSGLERVTIYRSGLAKLPRQSVRVLAEP